MSRAPVVRHLDTSLHRVSTTVALVPLRAPGAGKSRLATVLSPSQRAALAGAMLSDVVAALVGSAVDEVVVVAGGEGAAAAAGALGVGVLLDPPEVTDLDGALHAAAGRLPAEHDLLVVAADLPTLSAADVDAVLQARAEVVVAPTTGGGTGALLRRPGGRMPTAYGPGSAAAHRALAAAHGASVDTVSAPGLALDVDTWADLAALHDTEVGGATARLLPELLGPARRAT
jgi:2-phospho-L-lactate/phosphoenolpyruvate guanylyltransferase